MKDFVQGVPYSMHTESISRSIRTMNKDPRSLFSKKSFNEKSKYLEKGMFQAYETLNIIYSTQSENSIKNRCSIRKNLCWSFELFWCTFCISIQFENVTLMDLYDTLSKKFQKSGLDRTTVSRQRWNTLYNWVTIFLRIPKFWNFSLSPDFVTLLTTFLPRSPSLSRCQYVQFIDCLCTLSLIH